MSILTEIKKVSFHPLQRKIITAAHDQHFTIVITAYNASEYIQKCLFSACTQNYKGFDIIAIDADSTDETLSIMEKFTEVYDNLYVLQNSSRKYQTENILMGTSLAMENSIIISLDGDDWLANNHVLETLNKVYQDPNVWITYGRYEHANGNPIPTDAHHKYPEEVINNNSYRRYHKQLFTHLRTWRRELFLSVPQNYLKKDGEFAKNAGDVFFGMALLELAGPRQHFVDDIVYVYNTENPTSDYKITADEQLECAEYAKSLPPLTKLLHL